MYLIKEKSYDCDIERFQKNIIDPYPLLIYDPVEHENLASQTLFRRVV